VAFTEAVDQPTASVNHLTEAGTVTQLPRLININGGGFHNTTASVMSLIEAVRLRKPPPYEFNRGGFCYVPASIKYFQIKKWLFHFIL
jgi:hypothetical protein